MSQRELIGYLKWEQMGVKFPLIETQEKKCNVLQLTSPMYWLNFFSFSTLFRSSIFTM